jgi:long-chain acyl-CoA synthetase
MTEPRRLFDCLQYHLDRTPLEDMLAAKKVANGENTAHRK